ncbi:MAG: AMP-binding protein [Thermoleophilia bacterium]
MPQWIEGYNPYELEDAEKYERLRWWLGMTWGDVLDKASDLYPNNTAVVDDIRVLSFGELRAQVDRLALSLIDIGLASRDCVLVQLPNWHEYVVAFLAVQKCGGIVAPMLPRYSEAEINHFAQLTDAKGWILPAQYGKADYRSMARKSKQHNPLLKHVITVRGDWPGESLSFEKLINDADLHAEGVKAIQERRPDPTQVAQILPTGGTTGMPKAAPRTHNDYLSNVEYHSRVWEMTLNDTVLVVTPVTHNLAAHWGIGGALFNFAKLVLLDSTDPEIICQMIEREGVTAMAAVPAIITRLVGFQDLGRYDLNSLKKISVGGAASTPDLVDTVWSKIGCKYYNGFGSVEGACASTRSDDSSETIRYSVGKADCPYDTLKIVDPDGNEVPHGQEGELVAKGPGVFTGYFKSPEDHDAVFTQDGFFRMGDLAKKDELGNISITGRIKDVINRGGEMISAGGIENMMSGFAGIESVAVIGMPDPILGERICAYVQASPGATIEFDEVITYLKSLGASVLQLPERLEVIDSLPLTKVGKCDKKALREDIKIRLDIQRF